MRGELTYHGNKTNKKGKGTQKTKASRDFDDGGGAPWPTRRSKRQACNRRQLVAPPYQRNTAWRNTGNNRRMAQGILLHTRSVFDPCFGITLALGHNGAPPLVAPPSSPANGKQQRRKKRLLAQLPHQNPRCLHAHP